MSNYLPRNVRVGQTVSVRLRLGKDTESERGEIIEIPSHRRFAVVRFCFPVKGLFGVELERSSCECFPIMPPPIHEAELDAYGGAEGGGFAGLRKLQSEAQFSHNTKRSCAGLWGQAPFPA